MKSRLAAALVMSCLVLSFPVLAESQSADPGPPFRRPQVTAGMWIGLGVGAAGGFALGMSACRPGGFIQIPCPVTGVLLGLFFAGPGMLLGGFIEGLFTPPGQATSRLMLLPTITLGETPSLDLAIRF